MTSHEFDAASNLGMGEDPTCGMLNGMLGAVLIGYINWERTLNAHVKCNADTKGRTDGIALS